MSRSGGFGEQLRRLRTAAGLTQEQLAEKAKLSTRAVSDLERGVTAPLAARRPRSWPTRSACRPPVARPS